MTISLEDTYGNATSNTGSSIAVTLTSNTTGTYIFNTTSGAKTPTGKSTSYSISNGKASTTVNYGDSALGHADDHRGNNVIRLCHPAGDDHRGAHQAGIHDGSSGGQRLHGRQSRPDHGHRGDRGQPTGDCR